MDRQDEDALSHVMLSVGAVQRWKAHAGAAVRELAARNALPTVEDIPDELVRAEADGALTIYARIADGVEVSMRVEPGDWAWMVPRNQ